MTWVAGVDGCRGGWFVVKWDGDANWTGRLCSDFASVVSCTEDCAIACVDMPIGLLPRGKPGGRDCEIQARRLLGTPRRNSVFSAPSRPALAATTFRQAQRLNAPAGLTKQAFALFPKLREVDDAMSAQIQARIKEVHPELCFFAMNGNRPMQHAKRNPAGRAKRQALLDGLKGWSRWYLDIRKHYSRKRVGLDDILDACAAAWTALRIVKGRAQRVPLQPSRDERGLFMEIWY